MLRHIRLWSVAEIAPDSVRADAHRSAAHRRPARTGRRGGLLRPPGVHNLALWEALRGSSDPARRRPPRAGRGLRRRRLRARHRPARRRADHDRARSGQHARRRRRGVGVALADPRDRHRHPRRAAPPRRVPRRAARDDDQAAMFAPVVKSPTSRVAADLAIAVHRGAVRARPPPPRVRSTWRCRPTCSPPRCRRPARHRRGAAPTPSDPTRPRRRAPRGAPSGRCCGSAAARATRAARSRGWPSGSRAPVLTTYGARGRAAAGPPVPASGCRRTCEAAAGCGTRRTW